MRRRGTQRGALVGRGRAWRRWVNGWVDYVIAHRRRDPLQVFRPKYFLRSPGRRISVNISQSPRPSSSSCSPSTMSPLPAIITSLVRPLAISAITTAAARPILDRLTRKSTINYPGHVPLNSLENAFLAVGSGVVGVSDTRRGGEHSEYPGRLRANPEETSSRYSRKHPRNHSSRRCMHRSNPRGKAVRYYTTGPSSTAPPSISPPSSDLNAEPSAGNGSNGSRPGH